jgi:translin
MIDLTGIEKKFMKKEEAIDKITAENRLLVRACSNAIKAIHSRDTKAAAKYLAEAEDGIKPLLKFRDEFPAQINHIMQEYAEARIVFEAVAKKRILSYEELAVGEVSYLNGLLDATGELKREMYEALRHKERKEAEKYFALMEEIYDALLPLRFSNAVLPEFRRKQDVARIQLEQARGELL